MGRKILFCPFCSSKIDVYVRTYDLGWLAFCSKCGLLMAEPTTVTLDRALKSARYVVKDDKKLTVEEWLRGLS